MKKYYLLLFLLFFQCSCKSSDTINVKKRIEKSISNYKTACIYVKHDNYESPNDSIIGSDEDTIEILISDTLEKIGISIIDEEKGLEPTLKVECHFLHGHGLPTFRRHFKISTEYITLINIKFINPLSNTVIGEVEYIKPFFQVNQNDIISKLINELIKSGDKRV